jgi:hypothetical protein
VNKSLARMYGKCDIHINNAFHYVFEEIYKGFNHQAEIAGTPSIPY